ncbi:phage tail tape measure protein [Escherichia coli]|nr:phage tail tape measure protein [Escherichia coli]
MSTKFRTVITTAGAAKLAAATAPGGRKVNITTMAVGDGGGKLPVPDAGQTGLIHEVWRHALNKISQDKRNSNYIIAELVIPPEVGGFWMRELGLYDDAGTLIAVANMAESYKPALAEGSGRSQTCRMVIIVSSVASVELTIDTTTVMATQDYVDDKIAEHEQSRRHPDASLTAKGFTQLSSATNSTSETLAATPKAVKAAYDLATGGSAVVTRLQAPTGKAWDALKELGVKTSDKKGNMRPLFTILKEIQASFDKHKLGTSQKGEYLKTIFGEEALKSANVLLAAAASGKLDKLTATLKASDGKTEELVKIMQDNLGGDFKEFQSAYEAVGTDLFDQQEGALRKLTQTATKYVLKLDGWIQKNKSLASTIGLIAGGALALTGIIGAIGLVAWPVITGINAIIAAAGAMGAIFTTVGSAVMTAIGAISWPVVAVVAAIVAGALLIRKYWEPVSAFFGGVMEGLKAAFAPVGELFTPLKPVFDWLGEKLQAAWQWFKNLIAPVKATQDTLNRCRDTGVMFGQALADALMLPLNAFNKLRSGIDWVLEKLGVINKESDTLDQTAARTHAATYGTGGYIPATSSYAGYQPVTAPAGRSYVDQSKNEYHINLTGGTAPGTQLDRQLQDALEKYERDKRARARASMMHDG